MNHDEAMQEMATERYLLDELSTELREAFEEHMFDCQECAFDVRAGNVFLTEAKVQLPAIVASAEAAEPARPQASPDANPAPRKPKKPWWSFLAAPAFAVPAFAMLLGVVAFQNVSTIPALRSAATQPRMLPWSSLHMGTRGAEPTVVQADRKQGAVILIDLPQQPVYTSYAVDLFDPQGKRIWTRTVVASSQGDSGTGTFSLLIPGAGLEQGSYALNLAGISPQGARTELGRRSLDVHLDQ
jgi:anti-sigma factor RsiW